MSAPIVVATGTRREAATLRSADLRVIAAGGDPIRLRRELDEAAAGACAIASFGMAGALHPRLEIGDWVVAERLVGAVETECDPSWRDSLIDALPGARLGAVFADGRMIDSVAEKSALAERHGALAVDMESHVSAAVALEHGLPFGVVRCISDRADQVLPRAITVAMRPGGAIDAGAVLRSIAADPRQLGELARVTLGFARAMRALNRGAARLGPRLSFPV